MSAMEKLLAAVQKTQERGGFKDPHADKFWRLEGDKAGNGYAILRFLPGPTEDDVPFIKVFAHGFKNDAGRWFIENCPTTIGEPCPVCEANGPLWNSGVEKDKEIVRLRKRKVAYISNVLVVSDSKNPDNEGKVFLFKYGQKIFDKVVGALTPEFEDEKPINPFDNKIGANFKFKMRQVEGYANYDKSEFDKCEAIGNDKEIAAIMKQTHDISVFLSAGEFKPYTDLKKKFDLIVGSVGANMPVRDDDGDAEFARRAAAAEARKADEKPDAVKEDKPATSKKPTLETSDDDDMAYFRSLAEE